MLNTTPDLTFEQAKILFDQGKFTEALGAAKPAAVAGLPDAQVMIAHIYHRGMTGSPDHIQAAKYYRLAAAQNRSDAYMGLGALALKSHGGLLPSDALEWFTLAANAGRQDAMRALGEMYLKGRGVAPDAFTAKLWLEKAASSGDSLADRKMADSLFETDPAEALKYYEKAAANGDHEAAYIGALMYDENLEVRPNTEKMVSLMRQAAENGHAAAQADYGLWVYQGRGVQADMAVAADWFRKSAEGGDIEGQFLYAFTLAKGEGVTQNYEEAYYWLLKSGESGFSDYDQDRKALRERLEQNVDPAILDRARARIDAP